MNAQILDWSEIPYVLAVCQMGSLSAASRMLGVNHSTVFRRVESVEAKLGVRLFERLSHGYAMTPEGEFFYERALVLRDGMNEIELKLGGKDLRPEGPLTVTTTDSLLYCLTPALSNFQEQHPDIELRVVSNAHSLDLMQRQADVALRPTQNPPEHWVGRQIAPICCATYASDNHLRETNGQAPTHQRWVLLDDDLSQSPMSRIAIAKKPKNAKTTLVSTVMGVYEMIRSGLGRAVIPCYLGEQCPELVRIDEPDASHNWNLWLLAHPDIRRSARVHAFFEFASTRIKIDSSGIFQ